MISSSDLRPGTVINLDNTLYTVLEFQHTKPGKGGALIKTKLRNIESGQSMEKTFRAGEKLEKAVLEKKQVQYLYSEGTSYVFMDTNSYEQYHIDEKIVDKSKFYLKDEQKLHLFFYKNQPLQLELPVAVELKIVKCEPGIRGNTVSSSFKPAELETGLKINVPLFINEGDMIKVDTRTNEYLERL